MSAGDWPVLAVDLTVLVCDWPALFVYYALLLDPTLHMLYGLYCTECRFQKTIGNGNCSYQCH